MYPDAIVFVVSAPNLSQRRLEQLQRDTASASSVPSMLIRLEGTETSLPDALDALCDAGHSRLLVQPLGIPFTESLLAWLPGAIASWRRARGDDAVDIRVGREPGTDPDHLAEAVEWTLAHAGEARPTEGVKPSLGKPGWQNPPDFTHHLLVCTGPRCHYRDAASLLHVLKQETNRQGISNQCLTARTGCLFPCNQGPMVALYPRGEWYRLPDTEAVQRFVGDVLVAGRTLPDLLIHTAKAAHSPSTPLKDKP
ncbi:MAG: hypothetical protein KIS86_15945 [Devosia sp.]|nr:hypothetical protein [Devosia sp.]